MEPIAPIEEQITQLNQLYQQQDRIYHDMAQQCGLSKAAFWVLYTLCQARRPYSQNDLCDEWFYSKQTIHSTVASLIRLGYASLQPMAERNRKAVELTEAGRDFCRQKILPVIQGERAAFARLTAEERQIYLTLFRKQLNFLRQEAENLRPAQE